MKKVLASFALVLCAALGFGVAAGGVPSGVAALLTTTQETPEHQVLICHHVEGLGNTGNGYNLITVDKDSIANLPNGHDEHELDLIPPFAAGATTGPPGPPKTWDAYGGKGDFSLIGSNCAAVTTTTTTTTEPPTTTTTTTPPTTTTDTTTTTEPPTTTTTTTPPTTTETTTTTTVSPPPDTTTAPETTTTVTTTPAVPGEPAPANPPAAGPPAPAKPKPPKKAPPKPAKPNAPGAPVPFCPNGGDPCAVRGSG